MLNPLDWIKSYALAGALIVAAGGLAWGGIQTYRIRGMELEAAQALAKATQAAREKEAEWQLIYKETNDVKESELRSVAADRDRALASLRNRPRERLPQTPAACAGASPAALSEQDAGVVVRLAAEADELRANYAACRAWVEAVRR
jgi:hypothetical protein